jgi:hypothetical protein
LGVTGPTEIDRPTVDRDLARVLAVDAGQDLDQGALPGPVRPEQGVDLSGLDHEVDRAERDHAAEALGNVPRS